MSFWLNSSVPASKYETGRRDFSPFVEYFSARFSEFQESGVTGPPSVFNSMTTPASPDFFDGFQQSLISAQAGDNENFVYFGGNGSGLAYNGNNYVLDNEEIGGGGGDYLVSRLLTTADLSISLSATTENYGNGGFGHIDSPGFLELEWIFDKRNLRHSVGWTVALIIAYVLILIIGIIGNCMVILVVLLRPQMRTVTNMFIMNLAVADLFVIVFCLPATLLANVLTRKWKPLLSLCLFIRLDLMC